MDDKSSEVFTIRKNKDFSNFILFSSGVLVSLFGSSIYAFAIGLYVLVNTGSGLNFAITLVLGTIPMVILNPFAGVLADKFDKKKIVVLMDILNGVLFLLVYFITSIQELNLTIIYISTFIMTIFTTLFDISFEAAIPNIFSDKSLIKVNSTKRIINSSSAIIGPMIGGLVFALINIRVFILINGISFVFSGITEMFIDFKYNIKNKEFEINNEKIDFLKDIKDGMEYLFNNKEILGLFIILISVNIINAFSITVPLPYVVNNVLKLGSKYYGIIQGSFPIGIIIGALFVKRIINVIPLKKLLFRMSTLVAIIAILMSFPLLIKFNSNIYFLFYYSIIIFTFGIIVSFIDIPLSYTLQTKIPDEYRGRVLSIGLSIVKTCVPVAYIISGVLINNISPIYISISGGIILLVFNYFFFKKQH